MKTNLIAFFADLFNVLEIHPAKCVSFNQGRNDLAEGIFFYINFICSNYYLVDVELECYLILYLLCLRMAKVGYNKSNNLLIILYIFLYKHSSIYHDLIYYYFHICFIYIICLNQLHICDICQMPNFLV